MRPATINFAEIIAHELRKRKLDVAWSGQDQFRIVWHLDSVRLVTDTAVYAGGHTTFTIIEGKIHCWGGEYSLFEDRSLDEFFEAVTKCWLMRSCNDCVLYKE